MAKRMLIDAAQEDEQRVVVLEGDKLVEADFQSATKTQIKGNVYLARVTRVEPSLQAAFVDFGSGKHGFLPFSEIHPDYFQIPVADREALLEDVQEALNRRQPKEDDVVNEDEAADAEEAAEPAAEAEKPKRRSRKKAAAEAPEAEAEAEATEDATEEEKPKRKTRSRKKADTEEAEAEAPAEEAPAMPKRRTSEKAATEAAEASS